MDAGRRATPAISATGVSVQRGGRQVVRDLSFEIARGSVTGLLGPSGCGKSSLMRAIVGVQLGVSGDLVVLGQPAGAPDLRRRVAYVTQAPSVYDDLGVRENLRYFAAVLGADRADVERVARDVGLHDRLDDAVGDLSGGQRSRVSLATALLGAPELLVLDEPTVGLDPVLRDELWGRFRALAADGATLLVSSHVMDEATRCDQLLLMRDGALLATGSPEALRERTGADDIEGAFLELVRGEAPA